MNTFLKQHLSWHKARINCLTSIITALFVRQTVNPSALKNAFSSKASRNPSIAVCSASLPGTLSAEPMLTASSSRFSAGKTSASPSIARHGNTANPVSTSWCGPSSGVVSLSRYCGKRWIKGEFQYRRTNGFAGTFPSDLSRSPYRSPLC